MKASQRKLGRLCAGDSGLSGAESRYSMTFRVLLVEDDSRLAAMVAEYLREASFRPTIIASGAEAERRLRHEAFDAVVLDLMLPDMDGLDLCKRIRAESSVPVLMLTARGDPLDRVVGLELGADDYLPKPFEPRELLARLRAILRRRVGSEPPDILQFGRLEIDRGARQVRVEGQERPLTGYQYALLLALAERAGRVLSREVLMDLTKGSTLEDFDRSIDVHISRIRAAIEEDPKKPRRILTLRGAGYVFAKEQDR
jgi:DNA-binding response OmpR family regulator